MGFHVDTELNADLVLEMFILPENLANVNLANVMFHIFFGFSAYFYFSSSEYPLNL